MENLKIVKADSSKLSFNREALLYYKSAEFDVKTNINHKTGEIRTIKVWNGKGVLGLKYISIGETDIEIEFSAKILKEKYLEGINKNTLERLVTEINNSGLIKIDANKFIDSAIVYKIDITDNIKPTDINKSILDLKIFSANEKYTFTPHHTGLVITSKHKNDQERLILYDKFSDVSRPIKANIELGKHWNINEAKGIFRVESNNRTFKRIRRNLALQKNETYYVKETARKTSTQKVLSNATPYLKDVLESKANPNYDIFRKMFHIEETPKNKIYGEIQQMKKLGYKQHQIERELGMRQVIKCCNNDFETIKSFLRSTTKGTNNTNQKILRDIDPMFIFIHLLLAHLIHSYPPSALLLLPFLRRSPSHPGLSILPQFQH